jgi:hypothetical protein
MGEARARAPTDAKHPPHREPSTDPASFPRICLMSLRLPSPIPERVESQQGQDADSCRHGAFGARAPPSTIEASFLEPHTARQLPKVARPRTALKLAPTTTPRYVAPCNRFTLRAPQWHYVHLRTDTPLVTHIDHAQAAARCGPHAFRAKCCLPVSGPSSSACSAALTSAFRARHAA